MDNSLHQRILDKIAKLKSMTRERGASEQEALLAAKMMRQLMDEHNLTQTDLEIHESPMNDETFDRPYGNNNNGADFCCRGIATYCGVKLFLYSRYEVSLTAGQAEKVKLLRIFGLKPDVEMAFYLYEIIAEAIEHDTHIFATQNLKEKKDNRRILRQSFEIGMASRINARLLEMAAALEPVAKTASGSALVVVKNAAVNAAFDQLGVKLRHIPVNLRLDSASYDKGAASGDKVNLNRPINQDKPAHLLT